MVDFDFYSPKSVELRKDILSQLNSTNFSDLFFNKILQYSTPCSRILDIGTGNGYVLQQISERFPNKLFKLIGIDASINQLISSKNKSNIFDLIQGDNYNFPFAGNTFDIVTAKNVTNYSIPEIQRVLNGDGYFIYREYGKGKGLIEIAELFQERIIRSNPIEVHEMNLSDSGFNIEESHSFTIQYNYSLDEILKIVESFPFIHNYSNKDREKIFNKFGEGISYITSDPLLIIAKNGST